MKTERLEILLRPEVKATLRRQAQENSRSMAGHIEYLIRREQKNEHARGRLASTEG